MSGKRIGYIRVSTLEQNPDRQLQGIELDKKFTEYASARTTIRPQLSLMLDFIREDDIVYLDSIDRLARNVVDLRNLVNVMIEKQVEVVFVKENMRFKSKSCPFSNLMLSTLGAIAEFEIAFARERQREGVLIAQKAGKYKNRKKFVKMTPEKIEILKTEMMTCKTRAQIARELGVSRELVYVYIKKIKDETQV